MIPPRRTRDGPGARGGRGCCSARRRPAASTSSSSNDRVWNEARFRRARTPTTVWGSLFVYVGMTGWIPTPVSTSARPASGRTGPSPTTACACCRSSTSTTRCLEAAREMEVKLAIAPARGGMRMWQAWPSLSGAAGLHDDRLVTSAVRSPRPGPAPRRPERAERGGAQRVRLANIGPMPALNPGASAVGEDVVRSQDVIRGRRQRLPEVDRTRSQAALVWASIPPARQPSCRRHTAGDVRLLAREHRRMSRGDAVRR